MGAYLWWYVDAISDCGQHALSLIAFVGSVFSPYYARAFERHGALADPQDHCALNVALYGAGGRRWTMTERPRARMARSAHEFNIGPSRLAWQGDALQIDINEHCAPWPRRVRGQVRVFPSALSTFSWALDTAGRHRWGPIAPCARVEVNLEHPACRWQGHAYLDSNEGDEPVTRPFRSWDWSRARLGDGSTAVIYDVRQLDGRNRQTAERFHPDGRIEAFEAPPRQALPGALWRVPRAMHCDAAAAPQLVETLEDTPFYARSLVTSQVLGESVLAMHETLEPQRLKHPLMPFMLPWRMPRWG